MPSLAQSQGMNTASSWAPLPAASPEVSSGRWHRRVVRRIDLAGSVVVVTPVLLGLYLTTLWPLLDFGMYAICLLIALPNLGPFVGSVRRHSANFHLLLLFAVLAVATAAAFGRVSSSQAILQAKTLLATAVWASIYVVVFASVRKVEDAARFVRWINAACLVITASVYLSVVLHGAGISFGEVLEFSDGHIRAFGPLGDQVGFVLVLPALMALAASRPVMFGVHVGALLLTATRGAVLCLAVGLVLHVVVLVTGQARPGRNRVLGGLAALAVAGVLWLTPLSNVVTDRLLQPWESTDYSLRLSAIETGTQVVLDHPLLGVGFNGFGAGRPAVAEDWLIPNAAENGLSRAANQYVQTATDGGLPALLALILFVGCAARNALRIARSREGSPELAGTQIWLVAIFAGNLGALWLLSNTATGYFMFAVAGLTAGMSAITQQRLASARGSRLVSL